MTPRLSDSPLDRETISTWVEKLQDDLRAAQEKVERAEANRLRIHQMLQNLLRLLELEDTADRPRAPRSPGTTAKRVMASVEAHPAAAQSATLHNYVVDRVRALFEDADGPLHINDIHAAFREHGWMIPGAGKPANITAHIRRSDQIEPGEERGLWRLAKSATRRPAQRSPRSRRARSA